MSESWIIHPPAFLWSKCRGVAPRVICVWLQQVVDGPCHRQQLRQQSQGAGCLHSSPGSSATAATLHRANKSHQTFDCSALLTSGFHVPHRNNRKCALGARSQWFWRGSAVFSIQLYTFVRSKVVFFMLFCVFCCKACHHWKISRLYWYKNTNIGIYWYFLQNTFFYIPQNVDSEDGFMHQSPKVVIGLLVISEGKNSTAGSLRFFYSPVLSFKSKENMEKEIFLNQLDCNSIRILKTWSKITGGEACSMMGIWNFHVLVSA